MSATTNDDLLKLIRLENNFRAILPNCLFQIVDHYILQIVTALFMYGYYYYYLLKMSIKHGILLLHGEQKCVISISV